MCLIVAFENMRYGSLALIIHEGPSRKLADAKGDGHSEP